jgi:hypothetical protein
VTDRVGELVATEFEPLLPTMRPQQRGAEYLEGVYQMKNNQTVWVARIQLAYDIVAVGSTEKKARAKCAARAIEFLTNRGCNNQDTGEKWTASAINDYFGCNTIECDVDGIGQIDA